MAKIERINIDNISENFIKKTKSAIEGSKVNFLIGAGFSADILRPLNALENILECLHNEFSSEGKLLEAIVLWNFFQKSISPISEIKLDDNPLLDEMYKFGSIIKELIFNRDNSFLWKQMNIFTTNYDPFLEIAFEKNNVLYNDGFFGRILPKFNTYNFNIRYFKQALFSNKTAEIEAVNILKIHGSVTWNGQDNNNILYNTYNSILKEIHEQYSIYFSPLVSVNEHINSLDKNHVNAAMVKELIEESEKNNKVDPNYLIKFSEHYEKTLSIVNPTKKKFANTLMNKNYYELLRLYSNELEKNNVILFVFGFSFADEHIEEITKRSLLNPTLKIIIFAYKEDQIDWFSRKFNDNNNVTIIALEEAKNLNLKSFNKILMNLICIQEDDL